MSKPQSRRSRSRSKSLENDKYKIQNRVLIARYRGKTKCVDCEGSGLRKDALYVKIGGKSIDEINNMSITSAITFFNSIKLNKAEEEMNKYYKIALNNLNAIEIATEQKQPLLDLAHFLMGRDT